MAELNDGSGNLELTDADKLSSTWKRIEAHLRYKLDLLRRKNDNEQDATATTRIRAQIALVKDLLAAGE